MCGIGGDLGARILKTVDETVLHHHNLEKWFGIAVDSDGGLSVGARMDGAVLPFRLTAGASDFGNWVQILGSSNTPVQAGMTKFDLHRAMVVSTDSTVQFVVQIIRGESGDLAAKLSAEDFTEFPYVSGSNNNDSGIADIIDERCDVCSKMWARCACIGQTGKVIDFYFGIHEYIE